MFSTILGRIAAPRPSQALCIVQQQRTVISKSTRNKGTVWIGAHKDPLTVEQHQRMRRKHKPFVLGRDNVKRNFEPIRMTESSLSISKGTD